MSAGCVLCVVDGVCVCTGSVLWADDGAAGSVLVWADTKPTVPTIVAAAMAEIRVLEAFILELL
ncbi:MAG: hypothetical protein H7Y61_17820 [Rhizobiales bacterium]|nr:hypothetical protein [Rhizobacter sp.]